MEKSKLFPGPNGVELVPKRSKICTQKVQNLVYLLRILTKTTFSVSAKIQDGRRNWKNSKF